MTKLTHTHTHTFAGAAQGGAELSYARVDDGGEGDQGQVGGARTAAARVKAAREVHLEHTPG